MFGVLMPTVARGDERPLEGLATMAKDQREEEGSGRKEDGRRGSRWMERLKSGDEVGGLESKMLVAPLT